MMAPFRVAGHYVDAPEASTSKTKKKVLRGKKKLPFIAGGHCVCEIYRNSG